MIANWLSKAKNVATKAFGAVAPAVKRLGQIGYSVGKFAIQHHEQLAPLLHGMAMMSGNEGLQKLTGMGVAASKMATMRQQLNAGNAKVASATIGNGGIGGVYNHMTGKFN